MLIGLLMTGGCESNDVAPDEELPLLSDTQDYDGDGVVDRRDACPAEQGGDQDGDGMCGTVYGDLDGSGCVDELDGLILENAMDRYERRADLNSDGTVDIEDLKIFQVLVAIGACVDPCPEDAGDCDSELPPDTPPSPSGPRVTSLTLINADNDQPVSGHDPLVPGAVLNLSALPARLNVRANVDGAASRVSFKVNGDHVRNESKSPYALAGDRDGDYFPWVAPVGNLALEAIPYSIDDGSQRPGVGLTVDIKTVESTEEEPGQPQPPVADAGATLTQVADLDDDGLEVVTLDGSASVDPDGQILRWEWFDRTNGDASLGQGERIDVSLAVGSHAFTLTVSDDGEPSLSASTDFTVVVDSAPSPPPPPPPGSGQGFAGNYPSDAGIGGDPRVILFEDFAQGDWRNKWRGADKYDLVQVADPYFGTVLRAPCRTNSNGGMDFYKRFDDEPSEMYARFYAMFEPGFDMSDVGKFPGFSSTFDECGWGGRTPGSGDRCWSARGDLGREDSEGRVPVGTYLYSQDQATTWGDHDHWDENGDSHRLEPGRWYCLETHVKVDTDRRHGWVEGWIDGELAYSRYVQLSDAPTYVEKFWMNLYHGGVRMWPRNQHVFFANVVIATERIGPRAGSATP